MTSSQSLQRFGKTESMRRTVSGPRTAASPRVPHLDTKKSMQASGLEYLQSAENVEEHYPKLDTDQVARAAELLARIIDSQPGDALEVNCNEQFNAVLMFKRRPMNMSTILHFAIWFVGEFGADAAIIQDLLDKLDDPDDVFLPGYYGSGGPKITFVSAIHLAAGLGHLDILAMLTKHACQKTSDLHKMTADQYVSQWACICPAGTPSEDYLDPIKRMQFSNFYQPIHDSTFAGNGAVTLWLLRQKADPTARNINGITPLHFVAFAGIVGGLESTLGDDLGNIVKELQRTGLAVSAKADMKQFIPGAVDVTPLEVAVADASRFPQDFLGLLAPCLANSSKKTQLTYFEDIKRIADVTPEGALKLVRNIAERGKDKLSVLHRFRLDAQGEGNSDVLASILYTAPLAASEMLELLEMEPEVEDAAHHPIPAKTSLWGLLQNVPMVCTYQFDVAKKNNLLIPTWLNKGDKVKAKPAIEDCGDDDADVDWHDSFMKQPRTEARSTYIKRAHVVTSLLPGILDIDVFMAIAQCQKEYLGIMERKTLQGAISCLWINLVESVWALEAIFAFCDMCAFITLGGLVHDGQHRGSLCLPIICAGIIRSVVMVATFCLAVSRKFASHAQDPTMQGMWSPFSRWTATYILPVICQALLGSYLVYDLVFKHPLGGERDRFDDMLLAACLLISCFRFLWMWRLSVVGSRIFTIIQTMCAPAVNQILFITFMLMFAFVAALMVLARLHTVRLAIDSYRGFLFGDGDGFNGVGMNVAHDEPVTFTENNGALVCFSVFGAFFFNIIVLNIIIAIYGHEYDKVEPETPLRFMMGRADYCVKTVLSWYVISWRGESFNRCLTATALLMIWAGIHVGRYENNVWISAALFAIGQTVLPMALIQCPWFSPEGQDANDRQRFLWICHSSDWQWTSSEMSIDDGIASLHEVMEEKIAHVDSKIASMDEKMDKIMRLLAERSAQSPKGTLATIVDRDHDF